MENVSIRFKVDTSQLMRAKNLLNNLKTNSTINIRFKVDTSQLMRAKNLLNNLKTNSTINIRFTGINSLMTQLREIRTIFTYLRNNTLNFNVNSNQLHNFTRQLQEIQNRINNMNQNTGNVLGSGGVGSGGVGNFGVLAGVISGVVSPAVTELINLFKRLADAIKDTLINAVKTAFDYLGKREVATVTMGTIGGALEPGFDAKKYVSEIEQFAAVTPYKSEDLLKGIETMMSYMLTPTQSAAIAGRLGDVAGGNSNKFKALSLVSGQVAGTGYLQGQDLRQFIQSGGFNPLAAIKRYDVGGLGNKELSELKEMMAEGEIGADLVFEALDKATQAGGTFYNQTEKVGKTLPGMLTTIADNIKMGLGKTFEDVYNYIRNNVFPGLILGIQNFSSILQNVDLITPFEGLLKVMKIAADGLMRLFGFTDVGVKTSDGLSNSLLFVIDTLETVTKVGLVVANVFKILWNVLTILAKSIYGIFADLVMSIKLFGIGLKDTIDATITLIKGFVDSSIDYINDAGWFAAGYNLIATVANGVSSAARGLYETVGGVVTGMLGQINPVLEEIGQAGIKATSAFVIPGKIGLMKTGGKGFDTGFIREAALQFQSTQTVAAEFKGVRQEVSRLIGEDITDIMTAIDNITKVGDTSLVDKLLKDKKTTKTDIDKSMFKAPIEGIDTLKPKSDDGKKAIDKIKNALADLGKELQKTIDSIIKFSNVFNRVSFERFSPGKMLRRSARNLQRFTEWNNNIQKLRSEGVNEGVIQEILSMGIEGFGIARGLVQATAEQRSKILKNVGGIFGIAGRQASTQVKYDIALSGGINVTLDDKTIKLSENQITDVVTQILTNNISRFK